MWNSITIPIGIEQSIESIFGAVLVGGLNLKGDKEFRDKKWIVSKSCLKRFPSDFPFNIFYNSYAIFYEILVTLQTKVFTVDQLDTIVETNRDLILDSRYIDRSKYKETMNGTVITDDDFLRIVSETLKEKLLELSRIEVTEEQYSSAYVTYVDWYKTTLGEYTSQCMSAIMSQGYEYKEPGGRRKIYHGLSDMRDFYNKQMRVIDSLSEENRVRGSVLDDKWFENEVQKETQKDEMVMFSIGLKEIDSVCGPLRRGNILGICGPTKGGKTRFTSFAVQVALQHGFNVAIWPLEGKKEEWESMLVSNLLAFDSYNAAKTNKKNEMFRMSSADILYRRYVNQPELRKQVLSAKKILSAGTKLGRVSFIEGTAYVEDMFDVLQSHYDNENKFDVLVVDQLINVMSRKGKGKVERISEAYLRMKDFLANVLRVPALGIMPSQLKQEVIDYMRRNKDETIDITAGAESAETIRTPDEVWGLFSSKEERDNNMMKIYSIASRHNGSFQDFYARCFLECCFFTSQDDEIK